MEIKEALSKEEKRTRAGIYFYAWKTHKKEHPMLRMALILGTSLSNLYQIIKRREKNENK